MTYPVSINVFMCREHNFLCSTTNFLMVMKISSRAINIHILTITCCFLHGWTCVPSVFESMQRIAEWVAIHSWEANERPSAWDSSNQINFQWIWVKVSTLYHLIHLILVFNCTLWGSVQRQIAAHHGIFVAVSCEISIHVTHFQFQTKVIKSKVDFA